MNHAQYLNGKPHLMIKIRDLNPDIDDRSAVEAVGSTVADFIDFHSRSSLAHSKNVDDDSGTRRRLLDKVHRTAEYLQPLIRAMQLEGNHHIIGSDNVSREGSPWIQHVQEIMLQQPSSYESAPTGNPIKIDSVHDEFHDSWSFYFPKIDVMKSAQGETTLALTTCTEPVYEKLETMLDTGFFSNTCVELRAKMSSLQAANLATGNEDTPFEEKLDIASRMNEWTIQWALDNVPDSVRRRYLQRGIPLVAGKDIAHKTGPGWIWSPLSLRRDAMTDPVTGKTQECTIVDSHTLSTPVDHPVPFVGGKMYCKLLSPARAMDYMYTDSLRPSSFKETLQGMALNVKLPFSFQRKPKVGVETKSSWNIL
jgi:hypothetical protein